MGYSTDFTGSFRIVNGPMKPEHVAYLNLFAETRRMKRDPYKAAKLPDPVREAVGLQIGLSAEYFVGGEGFAGQDRDDSVTDYNYPPKGQPSLWNQWVVSADGKRIEWDGGEKFYSYVEWIKYIINHFLKPWGYVIEGVVEWEGEDRGDLGAIGIKNNVVYIAKGVVTYQLEKDNLSLGSQFYLN